MEHEHPSRPIDAMIDEAIAHLTSLRTRHQESQPMSSAERQYLFTVNGALCRLHRVEQTTPYPVLQGESLVAQAEAIHVDLPDDLDGEDAVELASSLAKSLSSTPPVDLIVEQYREYVAADALDRLQSGQLSSLENESRACGDTPDIRLLTEATIEPRLSEVLHARRKNESQNERAPAHEIIITSTRPHSGQTLLSLKIYAALRAGGYTDVTLYTESPAAAAEELEQLQHTPVRGISIMNHPIRIIDQF